MAAPRILPPVFFAAGGVAVGALLTLGCMAPPVVSMAPVPTAAQAEAASAARTRVLPLARGQVFPRVIQVLMDLGYQVRCVNADLGQVNLYQAWYDDRMATHPELSLEATLLFLEDGPGRTRVQIAATGRWNVVSHGKNVSAMLNGAQPALDSSECRQFLELLEARLCAPREVP